VHCWSEGDSCHDGESDTDEVEITLVFTRYHGDGVDSGWLVLVNS
jgi:hypothetical protein